MTTGKYKLIAINFSIINISTMELSLKNKFIIEEFKDLIFFGVASTLYKLVVIQQTFQINLKICTNAVELIKFKSTSRLINKLPRKEKNNKDFLLIHLIRNTKGKKNNKIV